MMLKSRPKEPVLQYKRFYNWLLGPIHEFARNENKGRVKRYRYRGFILKHKVAVQQKRIKNDGMKSLEYAWWFEELRWRE